MTVYVDGMFRHPMGQIGRMKMSHLMADTPEELHAMAAKIGVARRWAQDVDRPSDLHYDIALSKRALAVAAGAVEITLKEMAAYAWHRRTHGGRTVPPAEALALMTAAFEARAKAVAT